MKLLQALLALFACAFLPLHAASLDDLTWTTTEGEVTITDCDTAATGELIIPDTIEGNPVTSIGDYAFSQCRGLTSITIPDGVTSIGSGAFNGCTSLTSITIPNSVTSIGDYAFRDCNSLTSVTIPDGVTLIADGTFLNCTSLTSITIGNGVTSIGEAAFELCTSLTSITIPDSVTSIGEWAFYNCTSLTSITFQGFAPTVGSKAFAGLPDGAVALVTIEALSSFGESGTNWNGLTLEVIPVLSWITNNEEVTITGCDTAATGELVIPDTIEGNPVTSIGASAFRDCTSLTRITIPDGVTSIENGTFRGCTSLTSITIPDSVTNIGQSAFRDCTSLTSITFLGTAPTVGNDAFSGVKDGPIAVVTIGNQASFGDLGTDWNGLTVSMSVSDMITALNAQNAAVATARTAGRGDVTNDPTSYNLVTQTSYNTVIAERDARPTAEQLANVEAERDARFTEDQIRTMSVDHTVGQNEAGNMQVKIAFVQSTDLNTYIPFTVTPDSLSVVDGKICMEFPPSDADNFFFRFGFHNPEPAIVVQ
ncbi:leucine-rich repeat domain-containing protein [Akkermansiaceae bacterium]|nr:leucine-rich repeat domain-containing protein [Akkermansiaceae bacterium]